MKDRRLTWTFPLPGRRIAELSVSSFRLTFWCLALYAEVAPARLCAVKRIDTHELGNFEKVRNAVRLLESLVQLILPADDTEVLPELLTQLRDPSEGLSQTCVRASHATVIPNHIAEFPVERIGATFPFDSNQRFKPTLDLGLGGCEWVERDVNCVKRDSANVVSHGLQQNEV